MPKQKKKAKPVPCYAKSFCFSPGGRTKKRQEHLAPAFWVRAFAFGTDQPAGQSPIRLPLLFAEIFIFMPDAPPFIFIVMS